MKILVNKYVILMKPLIIITLTFELLLTIIVKFNGDVIKHNGKKMSHIDIIEFYKMAAFKNKY